MKARTARAIHRLKQSSDFKEITDYLNFELEISIDTMIRTLDDKVMVRNQGKAQLLTRFLKDIEESDKIAQTPE